MKKRIFILLLSFVFYTQNSLSNTIANESPADSALVNEPIKPIILANNLAIRKVLLGEKLFFDPRLSVDNSLSCSSCHRLELGGIDGTQFSTGIKQQMGNVNSPTVFNSRYNIAQFWDGRADSLQQQALGPVENPIEMGESWPNVIKKLSQDKFLMAEFRAIYSDTINQGPINKQIVTDAIAEYERSLVTTNAPFDQYLLGDSNAISESAKQGYQLFKSYGCVSCHQGANVGGNMFHRLGAVIAYFSPDDEQLMKTNLGRFNVTHSVEDKYVFKVPGLRLVTRTAPYFHDGSIQTLEEAIRIMGKYQLFIDIPDKDIALIIEFLKSLVGKYERLK